MINKTSNYLNSTQMTLKHMGSRYPSRLSFSRSMLRAMFKENWTIKKSKFDLDTVKEFYFFPSGRWDLKTKDNKLFKLPSENLELKLNLIYNILKNEELNNIKIIDLRFSDKIIFTNE